VSSIVTPRPPGRIKSWTSGHPLRVAGLIVALVGLVGMATCGILVSSVIGLQGVGVRNYLKGYFAGVRHDHGTTPPGMHDDEMKEALRAIAGSDDESLPLFTASHGEGTPYYDYVTQHCVNVVLTTRGEDRPLGVMVLETTDHGKTSFRVSELSVKRECACYAPPGSMDPKRQECHLH
jgi:hypothetical protein